MNAQRPCAVCNADCRRKKVGSTYEKRVICLACHARGWRFDWNTGKVVQWVRCDACNGRMLSDQGIHIDDRHFCCAHCAAYGT